MAHPLVVMVLVMTPMPVVLEYKDSVRRKCPAADRVALPSLHLKLRHFQGTGEN